MTKHNFTDANTSSSPLQVRSRTIVSRPGQSAFRKHVILRDKRCIATGFTTPSFLEAAHIKPIKYCNGEEAWTVDNGVTLAVHMHRAFNRSLLVFDTDGTALSRIPIGLHPKLKVRLTAKQQKFMDFRRSMFFSAQGEEEARRCVEKSYSKEPHIIEESAKGRLIWPMEWAPPGGRYLLHID